MLLKILLITSLFASVLAAPLQSGGCRFGEGEAIVVHGQSHIMALDDYKYKITAELHRNFMPICPPDGYPMSGGISVECYDTETLYGPASSWQVEDRFQLVHRDGATWSSNFTSFQEMPKYKRYGFTNGPKWEPTTARFTIKISVIYASTDALKDTLYTLIFDRVEITIIS